MKPMTICLDFLLGKPRKKVLLKLEKSPLLSVPTPTIFEKRPFSQKPGKEQTEILVHTGQHYDAEMSDMVYSGIIPFFICCRK